MECKRIQVNTREYTGNVGDFNGKQIVELRSSRYTLITLLKVHTFGADQKDRGLWGREWSNRSNLVQSFNDNANDMCCSESDGQITGRLIQFHFSIFVPCHFISWEPVESLLSKIVISMLASSSLLDGRVESKFIPSKFDLQTSYALDVFIDKSIAIFLTIQGLW